MKQQKPVITEAHVQQTVVQFLELDGWRAIRTDPVSDRSRGKGFGEPGMPDYLFLRYWKPDHLHNDTRPIGEMIWVEFKRKDKKPTSHQLIWHSGERGRGAFVFVVDDIDEFTRWYLGSGLNRRITK